MLSSSRKFAAVGCLLFLAACATPPPVPRDAIAEPFIIERHLLGATVARGEFQSITGARRQFTAQLNGTWDGDTFTLTEDFLFDDGERDRKTWRLRRLQDGSYAGTREDVIGAAVGVQDGNVFRLSYEVTLPSENGSGLRVRFQDVMALSPSGVRNDAVVGWFGFRVASVSLLITREGTAP